ncbi:TetR/AcrR family transcriptional regulator [Bacillus horti]|uniref:AcrR family transcriptional regulator n=1 Tax=Caldalkalibacillus horti TaxID=77523 RepID=A0ABT9VX68_9BACI|nr:TetR/AcrR family transcriptional regulator [Bacillus horti]MDQ0165573.1 AcrR family transcriptional regulator [Bacillus horti]
MKSRFEREQIRLREEILNAALHIAQSEGWAAVSIRGIAHKIEYSTTKVYELFENKDHIVLELLRKGFTLLATKLEEAVGAYSDPEEKAIALTRAYCAFAWDHGAYYRIMFGMDGVPFGVEQTWQEGMRIGEISKNVLSSFLPHCTDEEVDHYVYASWGTLHGISSLFMSGRLYGTREQAEELALKAVLNMTKSGRESES